MSQTNEIQPRFSWMAPLVLLFLVIIYANSLQSPFLFDDQQKVVDRTELHVTRLTPKTLSDTLFSGHKLYRPLSGLTFALNYYAGKHNVIGYHVFNLAVHITTTFFLYKTILILLALSKTRFSDRDALCVAGLATILWAVHPIQTQAVTYIVQRMTALAAMFYILGIYCYLNFRHSLATQNVCRRPPILKWGLPALLLFLFGVASKENAALFPLGLLLLELFFFDGLNRLKRQPTRVISIILICTLLSAAICFFVFYSRTGNSALPGYDLRPFTLKQRILTEPRILFFYLSQIFYPTPDQFSLVHFIPLSDGLLSPPATFWAIAGIVMILTGSVLTGRSYPLIGFPVAFYIFHHAAESSILPLELIYEHRNYLPSFFLFLPIAVGLVKALHYFERRSRVVWGALSFFITVIIFLLGLATYMRNQDWRTKESFWKHEVAAAPMLIRPYKGLGWSYIQGDAISPSKALFYYHKGLEKKAYFSKMEKGALLYNLAMLYKYQREYKNAETYLLKAIDDLSPLSTVNRKPERYVAMLYYELAQICRYRDPQDALMYIDKALDRDTKAAYYHARSQYLMRLGNYDEALTALRRALSMPASPARRSEFYLSIGQALTLNGNYERGYWFYKQYLQLAKKTGTFYLPTYLYMADNRYGAGAMTAGDQYLRYYVNAVSFGDLANFISSAARENSGLAPLTAQEEILEKINGILCESIDYIIGANVTDYPKTRPA